jgi:hypothetical protein
MTTGDWFHLGGGLTDASPGTHSGKDQMTRCESETFGATGWRSYTVATRPRAVVRRAESASSRRASRAAGARPVAARS